MAQGTQLSDLPGEIVLLVTECLDDVDQIRAMCTLNRRFHWLLFDRFMDLKLKSLARNRTGPNREPAKIARHAIRTNSANLIQWLTYHLGRLRPTGTGAFDRPLTSNYFLFSLLADAPLVAAHLTRHGVDSNRLLSKNPDLFRLTLELAKDGSNDKQDLDRALGTACRYALPNTARLLLTRGADPNAASAPGTTAIHEAVKQRSIRRPSDGIYENFHSDPHRREDLWQSRIASTIDALLQFGADLHVRTTPPSPAQECDHSGSQSASGSCVPSGQTALHLAAQAGLGDVVASLLDRGARPDLPDAEGYLPIYAALAAGHYRTLDIFLGISGDSGTINPVVNTTSGATLLHAACRLASPPAVLALLDAGADPNVADRRGRAPLHEVLAGRGWADRASEAAIVEILEHFAEFGADPDPDPGPSPSTGEVPTLRQLAARHPCRRVGVIFTYCVDASPCFSSGQVRATTASLVNRRGLLGPHRDLANQHTRDGDGMDDAALRESGPDPLLPGLQAADLDKKLDALLSGPWNPDRTAKLTRGLLAVRPKQERASASASASSKRTALSSQIAAEDFFPQLPPKEISSRRLPPRDGNTGKNADPAVGAAKLSSTATRSSPARFWAQLSQDREASVGGTGAEHDIGRTHGIRDTTTASKDCGAKTRARTGGKKKKKKWQRVQL